MNGWFIAIIALYALNIGESLAKHGERKSGEYNVWATLNITIILLFLTYRAIRHGA